MSVRGSLIGEVRPGASRWSATVDYLLCTFVQSSETVATPDQDRSALRHRSNVGLHSPIRSRASGGSLGIKRADEIESCRLHRAITQPGKDAQFYSYPTWGYSRSDPCLRS